MLVLFFLCRLSLTDEVNIVDHLSHSFRVLCNTVVDPIEDGVVTSKKTPALYLISPYSVADRNNADYDGAIENSRHRWPVELGGFGANHGCLQRLPVTQWAWWFTHYVVVDPLFEIRRLVMEQ